MKIPLLVKKNYEKLEELYKLVGTNDFTMKSIRGKYSLSAGETSRLLKKIHEDKSGVINRTKEEIFHYQFTDKAKEIFGDSDVR